MKKDAPSIREVNAARKALQRKVREVACSSYKEPSEDVELAWRKKHQSPRSLYNEKVNAEKERLYKKADDLILSAEMGQITSEEFYKAVNNFR